MEWVDGALFVNPPANQVLADTGPVRKGVHRVMLFIWASTGFEAIFERRDAANAMTVKAQVLGVVLTNLPFAPTVSIETEANERLRLITRAAVVGEVEASIFYG